MAVAGRVAIVPKGEWNAQTAYKRLDAVTHNNTLYFAKKDVPAGTATTNTEYWSKSISGSVVNVATDTEDGLMPKEDKKKLDGIDGDVAAKLGESKDGSLTYNGTEIKPSVETGQGLSIGEDGKLQVNIDGTTLTMDQVNNVIKLADTLKDAIDGAFPAANVANNQVTTEAGFALDARQANPNLDGTLAKQISDLNGSLKMIDCGIGAFSKSDSALNVGTVIKTRVTFNKTFDRTPIVVVSWVELNAKSYLDYLSIDRLTVNSNGFEAVTQTRHNDTWKYTWYFSWIAIST